MLDPTNKLFHMKEILFVILLFITIALQFGKFYKEVVVFYGSLILIAILSVCIGTLAYQSHSIESLSYFKALMFGAVFYAISKLSTIEIIKLNYWIGLGLSSFISLLLLSYVGGFLDLSGLIGKMMDTETVMVARRELFGMDQIMFFYKTMPFCFFALIYALRHKKWWATIIILAPIAYGGSRTPMLMALAIFAYLLYDRKSKYLRYFIGLLAIIALFYLINYLTSPTNLQGGDDIKGGVASYLLNNSSVFSHGVGVEYWDPERGKRTSTTEMTYFEMLYQYGWILFPFVLYIFVRPFFVLYKKKNCVDIKDFAVAYLLYLVNAGTNPLLISSTGMYVFACALTIAAKVREEDTDVRTSANIKTITV